MTLERKLKTMRFWLRLGIANHCIAIMVVAFGCVYSGFTCEGDSMKSILSAYAFTLFTPQLALEVIILMALLLVTQSMREFRENWPLLILFVATLLSLVPLVY